MFWVTAVVGLAGQLPAKGSEFVKLSKLPGNCQDGNPLDIVGIYPGMEYDRALRIVSDYLQASPKIFTRLNPTIGGLYSLSSAMR
jgi:hypothetical protein